MQSATPPLSAKSRILFGLFNKKAYLLIIISIFTAVFLLSVPALAQSDDSSAQTSETTSEASADETNSSATPSTGAQASVEEATSADVDADEAVSDEDLGAEESTVLPDSPFYSLKRLQRGFKEAFTFDSVKKAELKLKHATQELADARELIEEHADDPGAARAAAKAFEKFEGKLKDINRAAKKIQEKRQGGDQGADKLLDDVLDKQIKQQKVLAHVEKRILKFASKSEAGQALEKIQEVKKRAAGHVGELISKVDDENALVARMDRVLQRQPGSDFKEMRNVEVLTRLEDAVPQQAREAIRRAQDNAFKRFAHSAERMSPRERAERFEKYAHNMEGDETRHMEIFDRLKQFDDVPDDIREKLEQAKDIAARRFQNKFESFEEDGFDQGFRKRMQQRAFDHIRENDGDVIKVRVMEEMRNRVQFDDTELQAEMEKQHEASIDKFKAAFPDANEDAEEFRRLSKKMAENPDPTTFRLLQQLEEKVLSDPSKREFIERMEKEAKQQFAAKAREQGEKFFDEIASNNPEDIEIFKKLQFDFAENPDEFFGPHPFEDGPPGIGPDGFGPPPFGHGPPPGFERFFDQAIKKQSEHVFENIREIDDPEIFAHFQKKFEGLDDGALRELERRQGNVGQAFNSKINFFRQQDDFGEQFRRDNEQERQRLEEEIKNKIDAAIEAGEDVEGLKQELNNRRSEFQERTHKKRQQIFGDLLNNNPFCDERCRNEESKRFQQKLEFDRRNEHEVDVFFELSRELDEFSDRRHREDLEKEREEFERKMREEFGDDHDGDEDFDRGRPPFPGERDGNFERPTFDHDRPEPNGDRGFFKKVFDRDLGPPKFDSDDVNRIAPVRGDFRPPNGDDINKIRKFNEEKREERKEEFEHFNDEHPKNIIPSPPKPDTRFIREHLEDSRKDRPSFNPRDVKKEEFKKEVREKDGRIEIKEERKVRFDDKKDDFREERKPDFKREERREEFKHEESRKDFPSVDPRDKRKEEFKKNERSQPRPNISKPDRPQDLPQPPKFVPNERPDNVRPAPQPSQPKPPSFSGGDRQPPKPPSGGDKPPQSSGNFTPPPPQISGPPSGGGPPPGGPGPGGNNGPKPPQ